MSAQKESKGRETKPTSVGSHTEMKMPRSDREYSLAICDCETDMATFNSLMFERKTLAEDASDTSREARRKNK